MFAPTPDPSSTTVGARLIAIEPNTYMHTRLRRSARSRGVDLEIRGVVGERIGLPDASADAVISSLVLCSVRDPDAVLAEVRRVLRPGGRFSFTEHVAAKRGTPTRWTQRILRRPWAWIFEGCSCERDLARVIQSAGFSSVDLSHYRIRSPFLPFNTHIAGTAIAWAGPCLDRARLRLLGSSGVMTAPRLVPREGAALSNPVGTARAPRRPAPWVVPRACSG